MRLKTSSLYNEENLREAHAASKRPKDPQWKEKYPQIHFIWSSAKHSIKWNLKVQKKTSALTHKNETMQKEILQKKAPKPSGLVPINSWGNLIRCHPSLSTIIRVVIRICKNSCIDWANIQKKKWNVIRKDWQQYNLCNVWMDQTSQSKTHWCTLM